MKRIIYSLLFALALTTMLSCEEDDAAKNVAAKSISLNKTEVSIVVGEELQLLGTILPKETTDKAIEWSSSDESIASINEEGLVTTAKSGTATITATTINKIQATCKITVTDKVVNVSSVKITNEEKELSVGKTLQVETEILPAEATNKELTYTSSDSELASVDDKGVVTALKVGSVKITATSVDGNISADFDLTITAAKVESIAIKSYSHEMQNGKYSCHRLIATVLPAGLPDNTFTWTSSNPEVATIDNDGEISAKSIGTTTMTVTANLDGTSTDYVINIIEGSPMVHILYREKHKNDDTKTPGSWTCQKVIFTGANSSIDMDYSFEYSYKDAQAIVNIAYKTSEASEIVKHISEIFFTPNGFDLLNPLEISGKKLTHFEYDSSKKSFLIDSEGFEGQLETVEKGVPVFSYSDCVYKHRLKSGDLEKNYSPKMWEYNNKALDVLGIKRDDVNVYKFELYTYIKPVAYEGQDNLFTITYYDYSKGTQKNDFQISGYDTAEDGSIIFKKDSDDAKWYDHNDEGCNKLVADPEISDLLKAVFSDKGWKVVEEWEDVFVLISNENPELWFRVWVHYNEDW